MREHAARYGRPLVLALVLTATAATYARAPQVPWVLGDAIFTVDNPGVTDFAVDPSLWLRRAAVRITKGRKAIWSESSYGARAAIE